MVSHFTPCICKLSWWRAFVSADQHQIYITLSFQLRYFRALLRFTPHTSFQLWVSKLLSWLFRAAVPLHEATHGVRAKPIYHGAPVTTTHPAAARWRLGDESIIFNVDSVTASGLPTALPWFWCKLIGSVATRLLIELTKFIIEIQLDLFHAKNWLFSAAGKQSWASLEEERIGDL
jgi:hypothetical protein